MEFTNIDFDHLNYEQKQNIIKEVKKKYNIQYGYIDKNYKVVGCDYNSLVHNLRLADWFNHKTLLVIQ